MSDEKSYTIAGAVLAEMDQEAETTNRLFEILPEDKFSWRPHPKAKSLGELVMHIAKIPGGVAGLGDHDVAEAPDFPPDPEPTSRRQVLDAFATSLAEGKKIVAATDDDRARADWSMAVDGHVIMTMPRMALWRTILLNHNYHHRGQLSTYLRTLDVKLPSIYGPTADDNPFA